MFDWVELALLILRVVDKIITRARDNGLIKEGRDQEIARALAGQLAKTEYAKNVRAKIAALSDADVANALRDLEPRDPKAGG